MNWNVAHRIAGIAAVQAHRDLGVDRSSYIPVHAALGKAGVIGMAQSMPRLFGIYRSPHDDGPAVLLNADLDVITQRHTAAHELGHHRLSHLSSYDRDLNPADRWGDGSWPDTEKIAEAFAAWFLMPRPAVLAGLERIAGGRPGNPEHAYLLARSLGTSYAGTVRHLARLSLLGRGQAEQWLKIQPAALKQSLTGGAAVAAGTHVHAVTPAVPDQRLHVDVGDLLVLRVPRAQFGALPTGLSPWLPAEQPVVEELTVVAVTGDLDRECEVDVDMPGGGDPLMLTLVRESSRRGIDEVWP